MQSESALSSVFLARTAAVLQYARPAARVEAQALLSKWCKSRHDQTITAPQRLQNENVHLQQRLARLFSKYVVCSQCVEHCCHSVVNRFDYIDCYLQSLPLGEGSSPWHRVGHLWDGFVDSFDLRGEKREGVAPAETCEYLSTDTGCRLPVGKRPGMCVAGGCQKLFEAFSGDDLQEYVGLVRRYARFRRRCVMDLIRDIRHSAQTVVLPRTRGEGLDN